MKKKIETFNTFDYEEWLSVLSKGKSKQQYDPSEWTFENGQWFYVGDEHDSRSAAPRRNS